MSTDTGVDVAAALWTEVQGSFERYLEECEAYGIRVEPRPELRRGKGLLCAYNLEDGAVYITIPDPKNPFDRLQLHLFASLLGCRGLDELLAFCRLLLPRIVAHELGHCFRHRYGLMTGDLWHEEHVANHLANALTGSALSPEERGEVSESLRKGLESLSEKLGLQHQAADAYFDPLQGLSATGRLGDSTAQSLSMLTDLLEVPAEELLQSSGLLGGDEAAWKERRGDLIGVFNQDYAADLTRYFYYALGWWSIALESRERHYVDEFARLHLGAGPELLPPIPRPVAVTPHAVRACYGAHRETHGRSETASRYFYKRYRSLLLDLLRLTPEDDFSLTAAVRAEVLSLLQSWSDPSSETLGLLCRTVSPSLWSLFPHNLPSGSDLEPADPEALPAEADRRLWEHAGEGREDPAAARTLERLRVLEQCAIFRPLSAEILLELARDVYRVLLSPGETLLWEGDLHTDVFIVVRGTLEVVIRREGEEHRVAQVVPGDILGEMAFFSREPRSATVRAAEASECLVLRSASLRLTGMQHPTLFSEMAGVLAKRLSDQQGSA